MPPLDRSGGRGNMRPVQQTICNDTDLPLGLLGRPHGGQVTTHKSQRMMTDCEVWTDVRGLSLIIYQQGNQPLHTYCCQCTRTHFENR